MKYMNSDQRKAMFAKLNPSFGIPPQHGCDDIANMNKFASRAVMVPGFTQSYIVASEEGDRLVSVHDQNFQTHPVGETVILAGEDYKAGIREAAAAEEGLDLQHMKLGDAENRLVVGDVAGLERHRLGYPVYSAPPKPKELISGGYGEDMPDGAFDQEQLRKGIEVEKEHVIKFTDKGNVRKFKENDLKKAKEIAKDHLVGDHPKYYDYLEEAENKMKADLMSATGMPYPDIENEKTSRILK